MLIGISSTFVCVLGSEINTKCCSYAAISAPRTHYKGGWMPSIHPPLGARRHRAAQHGVLSLAYGEDNTATTKLWQPCQAATLAAGDRVWRPLYGRHTFLVL